MDGSDCPASRLPVPARWPAVVLLVAVLEGCGGGQPEATHKDRLAGLVSGVADAAGQPDAFQALFVDGAAPPDAERANYESYMYSVTSAKISGDSATATVEVRRVADGQVLGTVQWAAARAEDGGWRLESAPLPEGG